LKAEIISVGTELLLGAITDTNATYLAQRLAALGIDLHHVSQVGDNEARIIEVLRRAWERSDLVITTGGLGPTQDDLTREAIAGMLGETLEIAPELERHLRETYSKRRIPMPENNLKQATLIPSAQALSNPIGTAPGWLVRAKHEGSQRTIVSMPGVPYEMRRMWEREVEPHLGATSGAVIVSKTLKTLGVGESRVEQMISDLMCSTDPTLAPYAKADGIHLRITAKASDSQSAREKIGAMEMMVRERLGDLVYGSDDDTPQSVISALLHEYGRNFLLVEVGEEATGALGPYLGSHPLCVGTVSVRSLEHLHHLLPIGGPFESLGEACREVGSRIAPVVLAVYITTEQTGIEGALNFDTEVNLVLDGPTGEVARVSSQWRTARSEVARLSGLAALSLLRKELRASLLTPARSLAIR
jgi:nicotinamide-nucleotide amidase